MGFHDYNCLQMNAFAVVSDSGTLPEESSFFTSVGHPFPAICIQHIQYRRCDDKRIMGVHFLLGCLAELADQILVVFPVRDTQQQPGIGMALV